ncbi:ATP-binding protein [Nisaea denitrificans]|uniref:ATP-binding protein n=1 Tax=Nisaea denitrificans TaxID=390877 RepID=UPI00040A8234|nr:ATP-binding protein [Nisaea denitrificans]
MTQTWTSSLAVAVEEVIDGTFDVTPDPSRDGIVVWNSDGRLSAYNRSIVTLLDLPDDALSLGMGERDVHTLQASHGDVRFLNGFSPEQLTGSMTVGSGSDHWQAVLRSGRVVRIDTRPLRQGGLATVVADVSEKFNRDAAEEKAAVLRKTIEDCPIGALVLSCDDNRRLIANAALVTWLGEDFIKTLTQTGPQPVGENTENLEAVLTDPEFSARLADHEVQCTAADGETHWVLLSGRPLEFEGCAARIIWFRDISVRRRQARDLQTKVADKTQQLEEALHRADLASLAKTQFLANMSHELRTPLNSIIGFSDLLQKEMFGPIGSERYTEFVQHIHSAGAHLLELINDILDVSRIELGEMGLKEDLFDLGRSVSATIAMIRPKLAEKSQNFTAELPERSVGFTGDERQIRQVLMNLLTNAVKFTDTDGMITLRLTVDPEAGAVLQVKDNGMGIRESDLDRVLNPFEQATDETYSRSIEGAGLGLYLTQAIAQSHGGDLKISSQLGVGTTVTVTLPASRIEPLT